MKHCALIFAVIAVSFASEPAEPPAARPKPVATQPEPILPEAGRARFGMFVDVAKACPEQTDSPRLRGLTLVELKRG